MNQISYAERFGFSDADSIAYTRLALDLTDAVCDPLRTPRVEDFAWILELRAVA